MKGCVVMSKIQWNAIQAEYPDRWVALTDVETKDGIIISANVLDECSDQELSEMKRKYRPENKDHHIWFVRTAEGNLQHCIHLLNAHCEII